MKFLNYKGEYLLSLAGTFPPMPAFQCLLCSSQFYNKPIMSTFQFPWSMHSVRKGIGFNLT